MFLRQSTAQTIRFGPFLDITDGVTEETGLTITPALRRLSKDGAAFAAASGAVNATHDSDGWYSASITTTDSDTVGELILNVQIPATALPVWMRFYVVEEAVYDAMYAASAVGPLSAAAVNAECDTAISDAALATAANLATVDTVVDGIQTDLSNATDGLGAIKADTAATLTDTNELQGDWANGGRLDLLLDAIPTTAMRGTDGANTTTPPTVGAIADQVWDELLAGHVTADSAGLLLNEWQDGGRLDLLLDAIPTTAMRGTDSAALASVCTEARLSELAAANLPADIDAILGDTNELQVDDVPGLIAALNDISSANVLTQVNAALDTAISELSVTAPTATPTVRTGLMLLYMALRNQRTTTATTDSIRNDAGTTIASAGVSDDGTTFTKNEYS